MMAEERVVHLLNIHANVRFGRGASEEVFAFAKERGWRRIGVVADAGLFANPFFVEFHRRLVGELPVVHELVNKESGPTYDYLDLCAVEFRRKKDIDGMVAIGGGSTLDLGKAISVLLTNPGPGIAYRGVNKIKMPGVPLVMIPTTAGTGSEVIPNAPFVDTKEKRKQGISTSWYHPELVILDPLFTVSCPKNVTIASAMDALLHHAVDAFISDERSIVCEAFAREAARLIFAALPKVIENPNDMVMRGWLQLGALYAGVAITNGGGGSIAGAASYPLEVSFGVPHGMGVAICGLEAIRHNIEKGYYGYGKLSDALGHGGVNGGAGMKERALLFYDRLKELYRMLDLPGLSHFGVGEGDLPRLAEEISRMPVVARNPVPVSKEDIHSMVKACL